MRPRAFIIEDKPSFARELKAFVASEGWDVEHEGDGLRALGRLRVAPHPDLVLLDLDLPGISGWGIYGELLLNPAFPKIPVLIVSASTRLPADIPLKGIIGIVEAPTSESTWVYFRETVREHLKARATQVLAGEDSTGRA
jgi:CheY-like chemotaxis protein